MRDITVTLYQFDELPDDKARERARQWWRDASEGDNHFSECVISEALEWLTACGFTDINIRWSGFWSQGDGASFTGTFDATRFDASAVATLRADRPATYTDSSGAVRTAALNAAWHALADCFDKIVARAPGLYATLKDSRAHYVHESSVSIDIDGFDVEQSDAQSAAIADEFTTACRSAMVQIYRELESAYDWENANEQIDDNLRANGYEFTADGARHS
jgi:hypothetical protein